MERTGLVVEVEMCMVPKRWYLSPGNLDGFLQGPTSCQSQVFFWVAGLLGAGSGNSQAGREGTGSFLTFQTVSAKTRQSRLSWAAASYVLEFSKGLVMFAGP